MPLNKNDRKYLRNLGASIVAIRKEKKMKQKELSDLLDIDDGSLRRIESGRTNPTTITLLNTAKALNVEVSDLFDFSRKLE